MGDAYAADPTLTVSVTPARYPARVTSVPAGIDCPGACSASFAPGQEVILTAVSNFGFLFDHWEGACAGSSTSCSVTMNADREATAVFVATVCWDGLDNDGDGSVDSDDRGCVSPGDHDESGPLIHTCEPQPGLYTFIPPGAAGPGATVARRVRRRINGSSRLLSLPVRFRGGATVRGAGSVALAGRTIGRLKAKRVRVRRGRAMLRFKIPVSLYGAIAEAVVNGNRPTGKFRLLGRYAHNRRLGRGKATARYTDVSLRPGAGASTHLCDTNWFRAADIVSVTVDISRRVIPLN